MRSYFNTMKNFKLWVFGAALLGLGACSDDEDAVTDAENPEIEITGIEEGQVVWSDITLMFDVKDNESVQKIEVYINGVLQKTFEEPPYDYIWETDKFEDGNYSIKAIAFDATGNKKEAFADVRVKNTLLKLNAEENYLEQKAGQKDRAFVFITDAEGTSVIVEECFNGMEKVIKRPAGFSSYEFSLTIMQGSEYENGSETEVDLETYFLNDVDVWVLKPYIEPYFALIGSTNLTFTNPPVFDQLHISNYANTRYLYDIEEGIDLYVDKAISDALVTIIYGSEKNFKLLKGLKEGESKEIDLSVTEPVAEKIVTNPYKNSGNFIHWWLEGYLSNEPSNSIFISSEESSQDITLTYPEGIFQEFKSIISMNTDTEGYYSVTNGNIPDTAPLLDVDYSLLHSDLDNFEVSITGEYDAYAAAWHNYDSESAKVFMEWYVTGGKDRLLSKTPAIAAEVKKIYPNADFNSLAYNLTVVSEATGIDGYHEFVARAATQDESGVRNFKRAWFTTKVGQGSNGRKRDFERQRSRSAIGFY